MFERYGIDIFRLKSHISQEQALDHYSTLFELDSWLKTQPVTVTSPKRQSELVISLTTIPERIGTLYLVIESLLRQTLKADHLCLWLDTENFPDEEKLPDTLIKQKKRGLTIHFCDNIRSYKKLIYTLESHPDAIIVTADDDMLYYPGWLEDLYNAHLREPDVVHCHRGTHIGFDKRGRLLPYGRWGFNEKFRGTSSLLVFPTGCGGILYFPGCFDGEVFNRDIYVSECPTGDDIWFRAMTLKRGIKGRVIPTTPPINQGSFLTGIYEVPITGNITLDTINNGQKRNDEQIKRIFNRYQIEEVLRNGCD